MHDSWIRYLSHVLLLLNQTTLNVQKSSIIFSILLYFLAYDISTLFEGILEAGASGQMQRPKQAPVRKGVHEQKAIELAANHTTPSITAAAGGVSCSASIVINWRTGSKSKKEEDLVRQKLTPEEEHQVLEKCYFHYQLGFPSTIWQWK